MRSGWKERARAAGASFLYHAHAIGLFADPPAKRRFILAYHRVLAPDSPDLSFAQPGMYVSRETFDMHVRHLASRYDVLSLADLLGRTKGPACAITFDDGWRDNYEWAFPILRGHGIPATIFLATSLVGTGRWPLPDRLSFYVHRTAPSAFEAAFRLAWNAATNEAAPAINGLDAGTVVEEVVGRLKRLEHAVLERLLSCLDDRFEDLGAELRERRPWLTWDEAAEMSRHGIDFGSHTENHVILTRVPLADARREIVQSGRVLAERLGKPPMSFCYPNGDYSPELAGLVAEAGYRCAVTTRTGALDPARPYELPRMLLHDDISRTLPMFACTLAGVGGWRQFRASRKRQ